MNFRININICRVCMKSDDGLSLVDNKELGEKFVFTTHLKLNDRDDMPSIICSKCSKRLQVAYSFVKLAHESEENLKAFLTKINKDFELVTNKSSETSTANEDEEDDEEIAIILDESCIDKAAEESEMVSEQAVGKNDENATLTSQLLSREKPRCARKKSVDKTPNNSEQVTLNAKKDIPKNTDTKAVKINIKKENIGEDVNTFESFESDMQIETEYEEERNADLNKITSVTEIQKGTSSEHDVQILDYTDEESQVELEILEVNIQPSEDTRSSLEVIEPQTQNSDGFLKEYQAMLEEDGEYLEDNSSTQDKTTEGNDLHMYDEAEELLDDTDDEIKAMDEANLEENHDVPISTLLRSHTEDMGKEENIQVTKSKARRGQYKAGGHVTTVKTAKRTVDSLSASKRFYCLKCHRDFSTKTNLTRHMATHDGNRPFKCNVCNKSFTQNVSLKQHMYTHTGEKPYQCEICHRGFTQCKSLVFHIRRHTGDKPFPCEKCGALFRQKDGLKTHILKRHTIKSQQGNKELTTCAICKQVFADKTLLQEHMKKHLNDYVRVDSAMSYANREINTDENSQVIFDYTRIEDDPLHDKANAFISAPTTESTEDIGAAAHVVDLMTTSALEPSRAKKFQCRKCFKCFAIKKNLLRHLSIHEASDFPCESCDLSFATSDDLHAHTLREHGRSVELYECGLCVSVFSTEGDMQRHCNVEHAQKFD